MYASTFICAHTAFSAGVHTGKQLLYIRKLVTSYNFSMHFIYKPSQAKIEHKYQQIYFLEKKKKKKPVYVDIIVSIHY
jgi:hypothetical protein